MLVFLLSLLFSLLPPSRKNLLVLPLSPSVYPMRQDERREAPCSLPNKFVQKEMLEEGLRVVEGLGGILKNKNEKC